MLFRKKNTLGTNLRRRFHHGLLAKRKEKLPTAQFSRPRQFSKPSWSPQIAKLRKFIILIAIAGGIIASIYIVFFSNFFTITKVTIEKTGNAISSAQLAPFLDKLKGKNLLFMRTDALTKEIEQTFKNEILFVRIRSSYPNRIIVRVEEYPAILNVRVRTENKIQNFVINQLGYAIFENAEQKDTPLLIMQTQKPLSAKSIIIENQKLSPILEAYRLFTDLFDMKIIEGEWRHVERELHLKTEKNFYVWIDLTAPIETQFSKLKRALVKLDIYREPLEYIDLRIAGGENEKVIFKRKR